MKISVVVPIHNEAKYLPYTLKPLQTASVYEFIFVLDRCTDDSEQIVRKFALKTRTKCKILTKTQQTWLNAAAEACDYGAKHATGDYICFIGADVHVNPEVFNDKYWKGRSALRFRYYNYNLYGEKVSYAYERFLIKVSEKLGRSVGQFEGVVGFAQDHWRRTSHELPPETIEGFRKTPKFVVGHILKQDYKVSFDLINIDGCLHLRPKLTKSQQELQGIGRFLLKYPLWKVLLHSILYFKISVLISYLYAKHGYYGDLARFLPRGFNKQENAI
jgi:glycosyltransferase involved in cell wall biosynthesis